MIPGAQSFTLDSAEHSEERLAALRERYAGPTERTRAHTVTYLDTFDWRLFGRPASLAAVRKGGRVRLSLRAEGDGASQEVELDRVPEFAWDIPAGAVRRALDGVVEMRRLFGLVRVRVECESARVLGAEEKTIARLEIERGIASRPGQPGRHALPPTVRVIPLKGYEVEAARIVAHMEDELGFVAMPLGHLRTAFEAVGHAPRAFSSKFRLRLDPSERADVAMKRVYAALLDAIEVNEDGTLQDLDSEFLHDLRVAVRRTRSALGQVKGVLPAAIIEHFKTEFRWVGQITGPTRDMDVYLLKYPAFRDALPEAVRRDLEPLHDFLVAHQKLEHRRMARALRSPRFSALKRDWRMFLDAPPAQSPDDANATRPIRAVAAERIHRLYSRVIKHGGRIRPESPAERLHELRIECKKLRYLLTFFRSLFPTEQIDAIVKVLKQLQDVLGDFNDFEVQQDKLTGYGRAMVTEGGAGAETLLAMGRLVADLAEGQARERRRFHKRFALLAAPAVRATVDGLFARGAAGGSSKS